MSTRCARCGGVTIVPSVKRCWCQSPLPVELSYDTMNAGAWMRRALRAEEELQRILSVIPAPVWNERRVLIWSLLDEERTRKILESR